MRKIDISVWLCTGDGVDYDFPLRALCNPRNAPANIHLQTSLARARFVRALWRVECGAQNHLSQRFTHTRTTSNDAHKLRTTPRHSTMMRCRPFCKTIEHGRRKCHTLDALLFFFFSSRFYFSQWNFLMSVLAPFFLLPPKTPCEPYSIPRTVRPQSQRSGPQTRFIVLYIIMNKLLTFSTNASAHAASGGW